MLRLYNTLTRKKENFKPVNKDCVGIYTCGPTVYWYQHIGNMRSYLFSDILKRVLFYNGYKVKHIMNVTDVGHLTSDADEGEDKMELAAIKEKKDASDIAKFYFSLFKEDLGKLNVISPRKWVWASKHIRDQIDLVKKLERKKFTYETGDGIYFDSAKFKDYGKLARLNVKGLQAGKRIGFGEKKNSTDFALWKFSKVPGKRQQEWKSPWGVGFPGWHLECSAMSMKYLGEKFDIHTGGEDHVPVHHTNEIAQSEASTGKHPFVKYWLHVAFLTSGGEKVSKSKGGLYTVSDLEKKGYKPEHLRYMFLLTHYRKQLSFSLENLDSAKNAYERIVRRVIEIKGQRHKGGDKTKLYEKKFLAAVNDDLNTSKALDIFWRALGDFTFSPKKKLKLLEKFDKVLGLNVKEMSEEEVKVPGKIMQLVIARDEVREKKMWAEADILRKRVFEEGFVLEDSPEGTKVRKA